MRAIFEHGIDFGHQSTLGKRLDFALVHGFEQLLQGRDAAKARTGPRGGSISKPAGDALVEGDQRFGLIFIEAV